MSKKVILLFSLCLISIQSFAYTLNIKNTGTSGLIVQIGTATGTSIAIGGSVFFLMTTAKGTCVPVKFTRKIKGSPSVTCNLNIYNSTTANPVINMSNANNSTLCADLYNPVKAAMGGTPSC